MSGVSPSDALEDVDIDAGDAADHAAVEGAEDAAESASMGRDSVSVGDVLLHTEPDVDVERTQQKLGVGPAGANGYATVRKVIHAVTGAGGEEASGTPAVVNGVLAVYHAAVAAGDDGDDDQEASDDVEDGAAFGGEVDA